MQFHSDTLELHHTLEEGVSIMFTLFVNGIPAIKLSNKSDFPYRRGKESWRVVDANGRTIDFYFPG